MVFIYIYTTCRYIYKQGARDRAVDHSRERVFTAAQRACNLFLYLFLETPCTTQRPLDIPYAVDTSRQLSLRRSSTSTGQTHTNLGSTFHTAQYRRTPHREKNFPPSQPPPLRLRHHRATHRDTRASLPLSAIQTGARKHRADTRTHNIAQIHTQIKTNSFDSEQRETRNP